MPTYGPHGRLADSWWGATTPATGPVGTATTYVGMTMRFTANGRIFGFRYYRDPIVLNSRQVLFFDYSNGNFLGACSFKEVAWSANGWQNVWVRPSIRVSSSVDRYRLAVLFWGAHYFRSNTALSGGPVTHNAIQMIDGWQTTNADPASATLSTNTNVNAVDVLFQPD